MGTETAEANRREELKRALVAEASREAARRGEDGAGDPLEAKWARLRPVLESGGSGESGDSAAAAEGESEPPQQQQQQQQQLQQEHQQEHQQQQQHQEQQLRQLRQDKVALSWEMLWQTSQTQRTVAALLDLRSKRCVGWSAKELGYMQDYVETARGKCLVMRAQCLEDCYGRPDQQECMQKLSRLLDAKLAGVDAEVRDMEDRLQQLSHLPDSLVTEYAALQDAISERTDYIQRLQS